MFLDVKTSYGAAGNGSTDDSAAFTTADGAGGTIYVPRGTYRIQSNITLSSDIRFEQGAVLKPDAAKTVTLNGALDAGPFQVFDLSNAGSAVLPTRVERLIPQWWGTAGNGTTDDRAAFAAADAAVTGGTLYVPRGTYRIQSNLTLNSDLRFEQGAVLKPDASVTVTLNGGVDAGVFQVFDLSNAGSSVLPKKTERLIPQWWGAAANGTTNDTAAVQAALAALQSVGGGLLYFPPGTYRLATVSSPTAPTLSVTADNVYLAGAGPASMLDFYPTGLAQACILFSGVNGGGVANLKVVHNGSKAVDRKAISLTGANGFCIQLLNSRRCTVTGNHLRWGATGIDLRNTLDAASSTIWTTNLDHTVSHNFIAESAGYGFQCYHGAGCRILGNHVEGCSNEGMKFAGRNHALTISGNTVRWTGGDGMDFYDGLTESTITGNTVFDTAEFGYELKGTFAGSWPGVVDDYVFRDNTFSGNSAIQARVAGIAVTSLRDVTLTANNVVSVGPKVELGTDQISASGTSWTKVSVTATASTSRAPDDSFTADTLSGTGTAGHWVYQDGLFRGTEYTVTAWLKGSGTTQLIVYDDVVGAQTQLVTLTSTFTRYTFSAITAPGATAAYAGLGNYDAGTATSFEVWGARVTGPASITAFHDLDDPSWTQVGCSLLASNATAPDGSATADTLDLVEPDADPVTPAWVYYSRHLRAGTPTTFTVWLKGSGTVRLVIWDDDPGHLVGSPPVAIPTSVVTLTSTWTRYSFTATPLAGASEVRVGFGRYDAADTATSVTAWGMQVLASGHGIQVTNSQGVTLVGNNVAKCAGHGIFWQSSARGVMSGNITIDNSWVDGVIQNGAYDGVNVDASSTVFSTAGRSCNGLVTNHKGGQAYGLYLAGASSSTVWGGDYTTNLVGSVFGVGGNYVAGVRNLAGAFLGPYLSSAPSSPVDGSPALILAPRVGLKSATLATGATPSVAAANHYVTANTGATTITDFTGGVHCQTLVIEAGDANTSIANNGNIATKRGAPIGPLAVGQVVVFQRNANNMQWVEIGAPERETLKSATLPTGATPSVASANHFVTANLSTATTITNFTAGVACQPLVIEAGDVNTSIANNANIATKSGANIGPLAMGQMVTFQRNAANTKWVEV